MSTSTLVTAADLFLRSGDGVRYELIAGELTMMSPSGWRHGEIVGNLHGLLWAHVHDHDLGLVFGAETGFLIRRDPDTVRAPDIAFIAKKNLPATKPSEAYWPGAPDLAVEVLSPSDEPSKVQAKIKAWLAAGAIVWVVDPESEVITCHKSSEEQRAASAGEQFAGEPIVPGFRCEVDEVFA